MGNFSGWSHRQVKHVTKVFLLLPFGSDKENVSREGSE
jgi:hypothetical protein